MKIYIMQIKPNATRCFLGPDEVVERAKIKISNNNESVLEKSQWPPKEAIVLERKPDKDEIVEVKNGKCVYTKMSKEKPGPSLEDRVKALEEKLK